MKMRKLLLALLVCAMIFSSLGITVLAETTNVEGLLVEYADGSYKAIENIVQWDGVTITNLEELKMFRDAVNAGDNYAGKTVTLTADIDLDEDGDGIGEEWIPIGYNGSEFKGTFDGGNKTVKNLVITKTTENTSANNGIGFFGKTNSPAAIKNLTIENVDISGSLYVGAVVGFGYTGESIDNCTVKGNIAIDAWWYAGGIGGNGYMNIVNNCHIIGNENSYIKGNNGSYIGGIWGFRGEGGQQITNCSVTGIDIIGVDRVGGIAGIGHYGNSISSCSVEDVTITATDENATTVGLIVGACQGTENEPTVFEGNEVKSTTAMAGDIEVFGLYGTNIDGTDAITNYVAKIGAEAYASLADAFKALKSGDTLTLLSDVTISDVWDRRKTGATITAPVTIDGNGKTIVVTGKIDDGQNYHSLLRFEADSTVKNLTIDMSNATSANTTRMRAISSGANDLTVENCTFIGNAAYTNTRAIIFGEGGQSMPEVDISVTNCTFKNWRQGVTDNENAKDVKTVTITGSTFEDAGVNISASDRITFTGNTLTNGYVTITSYTEDTQLYVVATGNTLTENKDEKQNVIKEGKTVDAQKEFIIENVVSSMGTFNGGMINVENPEKTFITADIADLYATESVILKLYDADDTLLATTELTNNDCLGKEMSALSVKFCILGTSGSWNTTWESDKLRADYVPSYATLFVDGIEMNSATIQMITTSGEKAIEWGNVPGVEAAPNEKPVGFLSTAWLINVPTRVVNGVECYQFGMMAAIDSLNYSEVGFEYSLVDYSNEGKLATTKVYKQITDGTGATYAASAFGEGAEWIFGHYAWIPVTENKEFANTPIKFNAYAISSDGKETYRGESYTVNQWVQIEE